MKRVVASIAAVAFAKSSTAAKASASTLLAVNLRSCLQNHSH